MCPSESTVRSRAAITPRATSATAVAVRNSPMMRRRITSNLDLDDALDDVGPGDDEECCHDEQDLAEDMRRERMQVIRIDHRDHRDQRNRQAGDDPARHP